MKNKRVSYKSSDNTNPNDLQSILHKSLPEKSKDLEKLLEELYQHLLSLKRGRPDYSSIDPFEKRIEQVKYKMDYKRSQKLKSREIIFLIIGVIGAIATVMNIIQRLFKLF
ncbi:MAG: hypothetical protein ACTSQN_17315 [Candidatus Heimdallarchaeota archaeon]